MRRTPAIAALVAALLLPASAGAWPIDFNHPKVQAGTEAYKRGDYEAALRAYQAAQAELPDSPEVAYDLGDAYMKLGRTGDARAAYEDALRKGPGSFKADSYFNLGNAFVTLGQKDDAITAYRQALKLDPSHEPARHNLEVLLRDKREDCRDAGVTLDGGREGAKDAGADAGRSRENPDAGRIRDGGGREDGGKPPPGGDGGREDGGGDQDGGSGPGGDGGGGGGPGPRPPPIPPDRGKIDFDPPKKRPVEKDW